MGAGNKFSEVRTTANFNSENTLCQTELDSHADTCVVGRNALIIHDYERTVSVNGFTKSLGTVNDKKIVSAVVAYDLPENGRTLMLVIHQAIHIEDKDDNLLCPMQMRMNGVTINEIPKFLVDKPKNEDHSIQIEENGELFTFPLKLDGVTSYFRTRKPTLEEYERCDVKIDVTAPAPVWEPHSDEWNDLEARYLDGLDRFKEPGDDNRRVYQALTAKVSLHRARQVAEMTSRTNAVLTEMDPNLVQDHFLESLRENVNVSCVEARNTDDENMNCYQVVSGKTKHKIGPEDLVKRWRCSVETAKQTIKATTQRGIRTVANPSIARRFRTNDRQLRYNRLSADVFTDTLKAKTTSQRGNRYAQAYGTSFKWARVHAIPAERDAHKTLKLLFKRDGVPSNIFCDNAKAQMKGEFGKTVRESDCHLKSTEPYTPWSNASEGTIRETKRSGARTMQRTNCPKVFWDDCIEREAMIMSHTAHPLWELQGETPETVMTGNTADISQFAELDWYQWCMVHDDLGFPDSKMVLMRYLGPSWDVGPAMCNKFLKANGQTVHRSTYRPLDELERACPLIEGEKKLFDQAIKEKHGEGLTTSDLVDQGAEEWITPEFEPYEDDIDGKVDAIPDIDDVDTSTYDKYVGAEVVLPIDGRMMEGKVVGRKRNADGELIGKSNAIPILDTAEYDVTFPEGIMSSYSANIIAENMVAQCDPEGNQYKLLEAIIDHKIDDTAVKKIDQFVTVNGRRHKKKTTKGHKLCCLFKDGTTAYEPLKLLKETWPVEVAEYAVQAGIDHWPAYDWWVPHTLRERERIIMSVKARFAKRKFKFGFEIPNSIKDALRIDKENGNTFWHDALKKEIKDVRVAFKFLDWNAKAPIGYQQIGGHIVWDVKMEDFRRKARYVAQGNRTEPPKTLTYASVVSRESVRIAMVLAALNDLNIKTADIQNAYLSAPCLEKIVIRVGPEFGEDCGRLAIIVRALYGLASSGAAFRNHLADAMHTLGYQPCKADRDVWIKPMVRPEDKFKYYAYVLLYVDDVMCIHHDPNVELVKIDNFFRMKPNSIGDPDMYLGAKVSMNVLPDGVEAWGLSSSKYVQEAVKNADKYCRKKTGRGLPSPPTPFKNDYRPEMDESPELNADDGSYYHSAIGILRWIVELGRVDIITEVSLLSSHLALPREGHLEAVFRTFGYLGRKHNAVMIFDPSYPEIKESDFKECDWKEFYKGAEEPIPPNAPEPRGKDIDLTLYVDSDHAGDRLNRRSRTGFFIFLNNAPIVWLSKKQNLVDGSVFGAEFCAMKHGIETARGLRYKLRMMGVEINGATKVYGDNMSVIHNVTKPESTLKKKSNSVAYHLCRESVAMGESLATHISTVDNPADIATKVIPGGKKRDTLVSKILWYLS